MLRTLAVVALCCCSSCGGTQPTSPQPQSDAPAPPTSDDDTKRRSVLEVATKVDTIRTAAAAQDYEALRAQMCEAFDGGTVKGRDAVLASWRADPQHLQTLVRVLDGDCALDEQDGMRWHCRPRAGTEGATRELVELRHDTRGWQWCLFASG